MQPLSVVELNAWLNDAVRLAPLLLDVREAWEVQLCALPSSTHVPMHEVPARLAEFDPEAEIVCVCHHGGRSAQVAMFLESRGYGRVWNLSGGVDAWARQIDPSMAVY